jgi:hypothetical protein
MPKIIEIESPIVAIGRLIGPRTMPAMAALFGALVFVAIAGSSIINPARLGWIASSGDATSYLGWLFYRLAPWAWPPGALHAAGFESGSLVAAGSIPLLAFFFKLFAHVLPANFQYFGLWLLACYALQGFFAYRLLALFTQRTPLLSGGVLLFLLSPLLLARVHAVPALAAQWIVLAALYLYYANRAQGRAVAWVALLWLATLVQGYFALMVLAIWLAHSVQRRHAVAKAMVWMVAALAGSVALMWLAGYFTPSPVAANRFGTDSMNVLAPLLPLGQAPFRMPVPALAVPGQVEDFNYLGLGVLAALVATATWRMSRRQHWLSDTSSVTPDRSLVIACVVLTVLAMSGVVAWASDRLFAGSMSTLLIELGASGRLFWPAYYLLVLAALRGLLRLPARMIGYAVLAVLVLQLIDVMPYVHATQRGFAARAQAEGFPSLDSPFWRQARARYTHLHLASPAADATLVNDYRYAAGLYGFVVDPLEREGRSAALPSTMQRRAELLSGRAEPDSLYVVPFDTLQTLEKKPTLFPAATGFGIVDGLSIVAPGWFNAVGSDALHRHGDLDYSPVPLNQTISFAKDGNGAALLASGWSGQEDTGFSSDGASSTLAFHVPDASGDLRVVFDVLPYLPAPFPRLAVDLQVNGKLAGHWSFDSNRAKPPTTLVIPSTTFARQKNLVVRFVFDSPRSPLEAKASADPRKLALFLRSMRIQSAKAPFDSTTADTSD